MASADVVRQNGWEKWHDWNARVMQPITAWFIDAIGAAPGMKVLDAACGTGVPSLAIAERVGPTGSVLATDVSAEMLAAARRKAEAAGIANIEYRVMDVASLQLPDGSFDAVTCKDGLMFCSNPVTGARELRRVLRPGGRFAVTAWAEPAANKFFSTLFETVGRFVPRPPPDPRAAGPFRLAGELEAVLREAGFSAVTVQRREVVFEFDSLDMHWEVVTDMATPAATAAATLSPSEVARLREALADALRPYTTDGRVRLPQIAQCATGLR